MELAGHLRRTACKMIETRQRRLTLVTLEKQRKWTSNGKRNERIEHADDATFTFTSQSMASVLGKSCWKIGKPSKICKARSAPSEFNAFFVGEENE